VEEASELAGKELETGEQADALDAAGRAAGAAAESREEDEEYPRQRGAIVR